MCYYSLAENFKGSKQRKRAESKNNYERKEIEREKNVV
jgi:hypothetical protein